jgi:hypothetical protein
MALVTYSGTIPVDIRGVPLFSTKVPGTADAKPVQGGKILTDSLGEDSAPIRAESAGSSKATYTYITQGLLPYATPTDWVVLRGSATKLVKVVRVSFSGFATAATNINFTLKTHSVANTAGTSTTPAIIQRDSTDGAPTASILLYSVAPTISGTAVIVENVYTQLAIAMTGTSTLPVPFVKEYGLGPYEPWVLRGVAQEFALNFGGAAVPAGSADYYEITWTEE